MGVITMTGYWAFCYLSESGWRLPLPTDCNIGCGASDCSGFGASYTSKLLWFTLQWTSFIGLWQEPLGSAIGSISTNHVPFNINWMMMATSQQILGGRPAYHWSDSQCSTWEEAVPLTQADGYNGNMLQTGGRDVTTMPRFIYETMNKQNNEDPLLANI